MNADQRVRILVWAAAAAALAGAVYAATVPGYTTVTQSVTPAGQIVRTSIAQSLIATSGWTTLFLLAPVLIAAAPLAARRGRRTAAIVASGLVLLLLAMAGAASVGLVFLPAVALLLLAATVAKSQSPPANP